MAAVDARAPRLVRERKSWSRANFADSRPREVESQSALVFEYETPFGVARFAATCCNPQQWTHSSGRTRDRGRDLGRFVPNHERLICWPHPDLRSAHRQNRAAITRDFRSASHTHASDTSRPVNFMRVFSFLFFSFHPCPDSRASLETTTTSQLRC